MSDKVQGMLLDWKWDNAAVPIEGGSYKESLDSEEYVDSETAGVGTESITGRATRSFTADGKIKVAGVAKKALDMKLTLASVDYPATSLSFEETFEEGDMTDGASGDGTESEPGFATRKSKIEYWMKSNQALPARGTSLVATLLFTTGVSVSGNFKIDDIEIVGKVRGGDGQKISLSGMWQGDPTQTGMGLTCGVQKASEIIYKDGATTDKGLSGNAIIFSKSISADKNSLISVNYTTKYNGAVTETQLS